jgi:hypothetical protein
MGMHGGKGTHFALNLADRLGVDAVVRGKAIKHRYLSDLELLGVEIGTSVLNSVLGTAGWIPIRNNDIGLTANIIAASTGEDLFSGREEVSVNWSRPANEAIEQINRRIARRFP